MNHVVLSGELVENAKILHEEHKTIVEFTLFVKHGNAQEPYKKSEHFVICFMINPPKDILLALTKNGQGKYIEATGRINCGNYEDGGRTKLFTGVNIDGKSIRVIR